jgi:hypothetical protein
MCDLYGVAACESLNPDLRYTVSVINEGDSIAVRRKAGLAVCPGESGDSGNALFRYRRCASPVEPRDSDENANEGDAQHYEKVIAEPQARDGLR